MSKFVSIAQLQNDHKVQLLQLQSEIDSLKKQLLQQGEIIKQQALVDSASHHQQLLEQALTQQKEQLQLDFNQQVMQLVDSELSNRTQILQTNIANIEQAYCDLMQSVYEYCTELSLLMLKKITSEDSAIKLDIIKKSLLDSINEQQISDTHLTVHLNPDDASKLMPVWQDRNIIIKTTETLASGDVKISSDAGVLSGILEERVRQIMESINDDETESSQSKV